MKTERKVFKLKSSLNLLVSLYRLSDFLSACCLMFCSLLFYGRLYSRCQWGKPWTSVCSWLYPTWTTSKFPIWIRRRHPCHEPCELQSKYRVCHAVSSHGFVSARYCNVCACKLGTVKQLLHEELAISSPDNTPLRTPTLASTTNPWNMLWNLPWKFDLQPTCWKLWSSSIFSCYTISSSWHSWRWWISRFSFELFRKWLCLKISWCTPQRTAQF